MGQSGGQTSTGTTYTNSLPEYAQPYWERLTSRAETESNRPYDAFPGQRVAGFSQAQQEGANAIQTIAPQGFQNTGNLASAYAANPGYEPINVGSNRWTQPGVAESYMDPFARGVTDIAVRDTRQAYDEQQPAINMKAAQAGAYGGSRQAVDSQARARDQMQLEGDMRLKGMQQGYLTGMGQFNQDEGRGLQAAGMNIQQAQFDEQAAGAKAQGLAALYAQQQRLGLEGANSMMGIGDKEQQQYQRQLDIEYQNFVNQRDQPRQNLAYYSQILHGMPVTANQDVAQVNQTNPLSQAMGAGIAGLGLYNNTTRTGAYA